MDVDRSDGQSVCSRNDPVKIIHSVDVMFFEWSRKAAEHLVGIGRMSMPDGKEAKLDLLEDTPHKKQMTESYDKPINKLLLFIACIK